VPNRIIAVCRSSVRRSVHKLGGRLIFSLYLALFLIPLELSELSARAETRINVTISRPEFEPSYQFCVADANLFAELIIDNRELNIPTHYIFVSEQLPLR